MTLEEFGPEELTVTVAPILFGLDKFANFLLPWRGYLAPWTDAVVPNTAQQVRYAGGVIEIVAGIAVGVAPRSGAWLRHPARSHTLGGYLWSPFMSSTGVHPHESQLTAPREPPHPCGPETHVTR